MLFFGCLELLLDVIASGDLANRIGILRLLRLGRVMRLMQLLRKTKALRELQKWETQREIRELRDSKRFSCASRLSFSLRLVTMMYTCLKAETPNSFLFR